MKGGRRRFLAMAGLGLAAGGLGYTYHRGVRFPPLLLAGAAAPTRGTAGGIEVVAEGAVFQSLEEEGLRFRAFVPEPVFRVRGDGSREPARIVVENLHPLARLEPSPQGGEDPVVDEEQRNLTRIVTVKPAGGEGRGLAWRFPEPASYRFAAIGDSGGGTELRWVLERAAELGADFLVHLGDIYYQEGDFKRAAVNLNMAKIPTYSAIGNHDFYNGGLTVMYDDFHRVVGPSDWRFTLGGVEFVNLDTAADFIPAARGPRMEILRNLEKVDPGGAVRDRVAVTHMPLRDPDPERDHAVGWSAEARWLRNRLLAAGTRNLLAGHIHIKEEFDDHGLHTYITGQGLAHADLIVDRPFAEILLGDVEPGEPVRYQWQPLNMPFEAHCNERNLEVLDALERPDVKARLIEQCGQS